jgi:glycosyltransferase involved in cell wall biosynthesis
MSEPGRHFSVSQVTVMGSEHTAGPAPRKRIAVLFPAFNGGGGEAVAVWILEALHANYDLTLLSLTNHSLADLDRMYGTRLAGNGIRVAGPTPSLLAPAVRFTLFRIAEMPWLRQHVLMSHGRRLRERFDLLLSASNEMDFGEPGIQYFHDSPRWATGGRRLRAWSGFSEQGMRANVSLAPSAWMSDRYEQAYGFRAQVVHPPVRSEFPRRPWETRDNEFLCIARIAPSKRVDDAIEVLRRVREMGHDVRLRIVTAGGKWHSEMSIRQLVRRHSSWVKIEQNVADNRYRELLGSRRYGINTASHEGFGIGIAEMVNGGCIPFVRGEGGQLEILDNCDAVRFSSLGEGADRINAMLGNRESQIEILRQLSRQQGRFSCERFMEEIRWVVSQTIRLEPTEAR